MIFTIRIPQVIELMIEQGLIEVSGRGKDRTFILGAKIYKENKEAIQYVRQSNIDKSIEMEELMQ